MFFKNTTGFTKTFCKALTLGILSISTPLVAVEYGGEKSYLFEIPYEVCIVAPLPSEAIEKGITPVSTLEVKKLFNEGAHFYDARREAHFKEGRIKGAKPVVFDASKAQYTVLNLPENKKAKLVFYCYGESCANSYEAALAVRNYGYKNIYWYADGFNDWHKSGYPIEGNMQK
ncbi:MAG: rhodanese-like domain-containing protein [Helicobacteraceae bacterium]|nr:rhodanese-like domain-containing protein [Helicobacteraceae bacterium]